eukprot:2177220-Rhodomonas_salina.1
MLRARACSSVAHASRSAPARASIARHSQCLELFGLLDSSVPCGLQPAGSHFGVTLAVALGRRHLERTRCLLPPPPAREPFFNKSWGLKEDRTKTQSKTAERERGRGGWKLR